MSEQVPLTSDEARQQLASIATQMKRARTAILQPAQAKFGETPELTAMLGRMEAVEEELAELLAELDSGDSHGWWLTHPFPGDDDDVPGGPLADL